MRRTDGRARVVIEKNVPVMMSDAVTLRLNVFRPRDLVAPVVMSVTPYGKTAHPTGSACWRCGYRESASAT